MGKAKRSKKADEPLTIRASLAPIGLPMPRTPEEAEEISRRIAQTVARLERQIQKPPFATLMDGLRGDPDFAFHREIRASRQSCACAGADAVAIMVTTRAFEEALVRSSGGDPSMRRMFIYAYDHHLDSWEMAMIDVEDAKQLVNALSEAIAAAEATEGAVP